MPLHIDNRPKTFDKFVGNTVLIKSLKSILKRKDKPHSYLFYGPSGCGKTTLARIIANELKCSDHDLQEINMSNNRGIDTARDIVSNMRFKPLSGETKIYILDEVHKATNEFQNALLKALEDTPSHVYFILCTTDPEKLLTTIKNRCSSFMVSKLKNKNIVGLLSDICKKEKIKISDEVKRKIAKGSDGCPRQALVVLDQVRDIEEEDEEIDVLISAGMEDKKVIDLCRLLLKEFKWLEMANLLKILLKSHEPENIRRAVLGYMSSVALNGNPDKACFVIDWFEDNFYDSGKAGLILACHNILIHWED